LLEKCYDLTYVIAVRIVYGVMAIFGVTEKALAFYSIFEIWTVVF